MHVFINAFKTTFTVYPLRTEHKIRHWEYNSYEDRDGCSALSLPPAPSPAHTFIVRMRKALGREVGGLLPPVLASVKAELDCALWFTAFQQGHCYEPFVKYGNFSSSAPSYPVGTTVEFSCDPGYTLEQGSIIIECVDPHDPQWNETEPACRGQ